MTLRRAMLASAASALAFAATSARADEGMWTFDHFPTAQVQQRYHWAPDQAWLDHVQAASLRLTGGCSASFVSPNGLILTNHHCVIECVQDLSTPQHDYVQAGYTAATREEEHACPGQQAEVVTAITDVTPRMQSAIGSATGAALVHARDAAIAQIEAAGCHDPEHERCQVVTLYGGGQYKLYHYHKYSDVRLVFAPEYLAAQFGGDPDNFNFPRFGLDFGFLRAYENGHPVQSAQFLHWNPRAPENGELIFISGNPGSTQRLFTQDQLRFQRDIQFPLLMPLLAEYRGRLIAAMAGDAERTRSGNDTLFGIENSYKALTGQWLSLRDPEFMGHLAAAEQDLRTRVRGNAQLGADFGDPWADIRAAESRQESMARQYVMLENLAGFRSQLYGYARRLVRAAMERAKPNDQRLPGYTESALPLLQHQVLDPSPTYPWLDELTMSFWLSKTRELLTTDDPRVRAMLGRESPEELAHRLVTGTHLADPAYRQRLWEGGLAAIQASDDPMIQFALRNEPTARALVDHYRTEIEAPIVAAQSRLARARFAAYGDTIYPDATFTLRLSYGSVQGWNELGHDMTPFTNFAGMFDRATGSYPYQLPPKIEAGRSSINPQRVLDFTSNNDIIGGNSGSPVVARDGSVIGAAFDGNIHSLGGNYGFDPRLNRTIMVSTGAIQEALEKDYHDTALVAELNGRH